MVLPKYPFIIDAGMSTEPNVIVLLFHADGDLLQLASRATAEEAREVAETWAGEAPDGYITRIVSSSIVVDIRQ